MRSSTSSSRCFGAGLVFVLISAPAASAAAVSDDPPTANEAGLFGPPFQVPLLFQANGSVAAAVSMQLAVTPPEQHHGLMFIKDLPEGTGMLFLYTNPARRVLWMKNTYVALDAAWFTKDLTLQEVHHMPPLDLTYRWSDREDIVMGLEMPEGWFDRHNLTPGTLRLDRQALSDAIHARGFDPTSYLGAPPTPDFAAPVSNATSIDAMDEAISKADPRTTVTAFLHSQYFLQKQA